MESTARRNAFAEAVTEVVPLQRTLSLMRHWRLPNLRLAAPAAGAGGILSAFDLALLLVFFRGTDGGAAALQDRCCHRGAPLSLGRVKDNLLQCGYHGMCFDAGGQCVLVPGQSSIPPAARVRSYRGRGTRWRRLDLDGRRHGRRRFDRSVFPTG
jgi:nitrite reductase/ring-hydroxylating ferredoxin subunit